MFWADLLKDDDLIKLMDTVASIEKNEKRAESIYKKLLAKFPRNSQILRAYGSFLEEVKNDVEMSRTAYRMAEELEDEVSKKHRKSNRYVSHPHLSLQSLPFIFYQYKYLLYFNLWFTLSSIDPPIMIWKRNKTEERRPTVIIPTIFHPFKFNPIENQLIYQKEKTKQKLLENKKWKKEQKKGNLQLQTATRRRGILIPTIVISALRAKLLVLELNYNGEGDTRRRLKRANHLL